MWDSGKETVLLVPGWSLLAPPPFPLQVVPLRWFITAGSSLQKLKIRIQGIPHVGRVVSIARREGLCYHFRVINANSQQYVLFSKRSCTCPLPCVFSLALHLSAGVFLSPEHPDQCTYSTLSPLSSQPHHWLKTDTFFGYLRMFLGWVIVILGAFQAFFYWALLFSLRWVSRCF